MTQSETKPNAAFVAVTLAYWSFMLTDGALRMLVLLHFHRLGYSAIELASLFILYEIAGVVTNLYAGWIAARFGLASTLFAGLGLQVVALVGLGIFAGQEAAMSMVVFVIVIQGLSGVAKDLTKMSSKSAVKYIAKDTEGTLFRWVSFLTGSKNAIKGLGFFVGAALLAVFDFAPTVYVLAAVLLTILVALAVLLPKGLPTGSKSAKFSQAFSRDARVNWLSFARVFLFGARDVWFVVALPVFLYTSLEEFGQTEATPFFVVGSFMAVWILVYGAVQARTPHLLGMNESDQSHVSPMANWWAKVLFAVTIALAICVSFVPMSLILVGVVCLGLFGFGAVFAINSSLHSYLIVSFSDADRVTRDVGFYYMANAAGRLIGTILSGVMFQIGGLAACLWTASIMIALSVFGASKLPSLR